MSMVRRDLPDNERISKPGSFDTLSVTGYQA